MSIDLRANITCSLGTLISGNISDEYIQETGLIKVQGNVELSGIYTPVAGTIVTFSYIKDGITRNIPRKLRVLSSFADPFRRITQVELGCKLTYLADLKPAPTVNGDNEKETAKRLQCLNGYLEYPADSAYGIPISASDMMDLCLQRLGITASSNPLTNRFFQEEFDLTSGYVNVLSDLLLSESYCGYLNYNEVLQVFSLDQQGGTGPVINESNIIDVSGIGLGDRPGDAVVVRYDTKTLKQDFEDEDTTSDAYKLRNWEYTETIGSARETYVRFERTSTSGGTTVTQTFNSPVTIVPWTRSTTTYGEDNSWDDNTCVLASTIGEAADLSNTVIRVVTENNVVMGEEANAYCSNIFSVINAGNTLNINAQGVVTVIEENEYDRKGQLIRKVTKKWEPFFMWAGRLDIDFVFYVVNNLYPTGGYNYIVLGNGEVLVSEEVTEYEYYYAPASREAKLRAQANNEEVELEISGTREIKTTYLNWATSQQGNNGVSSWKDVAPFDTAQEALEVLEQVSNIMILENQTVNVTSNRVVFSTNTRPKATERLINPDTTENQEETTNQLIYVTGSPLSERIVELSMPYQSDDYYTSTGTLVKGDAAAKASRYGRCQNRLLLGNRYGMNIQMAPEKMPNAPFSALVVQANGLSALYRTNGTNWQLSAEGLLVSTDALFWGGIGGTGDYWFPVAPGIVSLPSEPPIVNGSMTVTNIVPPWNEIVATKGSVRISLEITSLSYPLELLTQLSTSVRTPLSQQRYVLMRVETVFNVNVSILAPRLAESFSIRLPASNVTISAFAPQTGSQVGIFVIPPVSNSTISALAPIIPGDLWNMRPSVADTSVTVNVPVVGRFVGVYINPGVADTVISGLAPTISGPPTNDLNLYPSATDTIIGALPPSVEGTYSLLDLYPSVIDTSIGCLVPVVSTQSEDPYYSSVTLLLHMDGSNGSTTLTDSSSYGHSVTAYNGAAISTAQSKFGGSSGSFTNSFYGGTNSYTRTIGSTVWPVGAGDFTVELWFYPLISQSGTVFDTRPDNGTGTKFALQLSSGASLSWDSNGATVIYSGSGAYSLNAWNHVAATRSGGTARLFVNGTLLGTVTDTRSYTNQSLINVGGFGIDSFQGYIDEVRVTAGIARYTTNFTPPTAAFPNTGPIYDPNFSNVSLLLHMDGSNGSTAFTDNSSNALTITANGNAQISTAQSKFNGASGYFDGSGDRLIIPSNVGFSFGAGDFTIELWVYHVSLTSDTFYVSAEGAGGLFFGVGTGGGGASNLHIGWGRAAIAWDGSALHGMSVNTWNHVALTRSGTSMRLFVNGSQIGSTVTNSTSYDLSTTALNVGSQGATYYLNAYIDDLRITKGIARYTTNFTPPTAAFPNTGPIYDPNFSNVSLLLHMDGSNGSTTFTDSSSNAYSSNSVDGNAQISTAQSKYGSASGSFDGSSSVTVSGANLANSADWTFECWARPTSVTGYNAIFSNASFGQEDLRFYIVDGALVLRKGANHITHGSVSANTWHHVAVVRSSGVYHLYLNGTKSTGSYSNTDTTNSSFRIGWDYYSSQGLKGHIDEVRITKGVARYTTNFTPPTAAFPDS